MWYIIHLVVVVGGGGRGDKNREFNVVVYNTFSGSGRGRGDKNREFNVVAFGGSEWGGGIKVEI